MSDVPFAGAAWLTVPKSASAIEGARWVWVQRPGEPRPTAENASVGTVHMAREWILAEVPKRATLLFTADNTSRVRVNGREIGGSTEWERLERIDVTEALKAGTNRIEVEATNGEGTGAQNPGGLLLALRATLGSGREETLVSDEGWTSLDGNVVALGPFDVAPWRLGRPDVPAPAFRREFALRSGVRRAVARVIGLGQYDLWINGRRQGDGVLNGPWSQYDRTLYWQEFDVTRALRSGANAVGVEMGNSFYRVATPPPGRHIKTDMKSDYSVGPGFHGEPYLLALTLDVEYADGRRERIVTDRDWRSGPTPYTLSHVYAGEDYDARRFDPGWARPDYKGAGWAEPVVSVAPAAELRPMDWPTFRPVQSWRPTEIRGPRPGEWTYVFPQNAMAMLRFRVRGPRGATVKFVPSEVMTPEGHVEQLNLWGGEASASYTLRGGAAESHEWRFFYHGFRYVRVVGAVPAGMPNPDGLPVLESLESVHVRTDNPVVGAFATSSDLYNRTHGLVDWAVRSNMAYVLTDCPHREKAGWLECSHLLFSTVAYRYDAGAWFRKITRDIRDIQLPDGRITTVAPDVLLLPVESPFKFTVEWGAAGVLLPWQAYEWTGDRRFLAENWAMMRGYLGWIDRNAKDGIAPAGLGDWYDYGHGQGPGPSRFTPTELTGTAMWALCLQAAARAATELDEPAQAAEYRAKHAEVRRAFLARFYDPATKTLRNNGSVQSGHAMALCADLIPEGDRAAVLDAIVADLERRGYQQTPGDVGHLFFLRALAQAGRSDVLHRVYSRTGVGSYGGILAKGLTTLPETWDAITVGSNSLNHCMLGHVQEWFYGWVLGLRQAPDSIGWREILVAPEPGDLKWAKGETGTPEGPLSVAWTSDAKGFTMTAAIPKRSRATLAVPFAPGATPSELRLDGHRVTPIPGPFGRPSVAVGPGRHTLEARR